MKKWIFVIAPACMLGLFLIFYWQETNRLDELQRQRAQAEARQKAEDDEKKRILQDNARKDSERRAAEQAAEAAKVEANRVAQRKAELQKIINDTKAATDETADYTNRAKALQDKLDALQKQKEQDTRDDFDLIMEVEKARVDQETADLENQRMIELIANKASASEMANFTPPPEK